jgi:hypothetical protein
VIDTDVDFDDGSGGEHVSTVGILSKFFIFDVFPDVHVLIYINNTSDTITIN